MSELKGAGQASWIVYCVALCVLASGCVMIESYYKPLPRQGRLLGSSATWNRADDLQVGVGREGTWIVYQQFEGWHNALSVQIWLSIVTDKHIELPSDDVTVVACGREYAYKLSPARIKGAAHLRREASFEVDFGKDPVPEFTLVLPDVSIDNETFATRPLQFRRGKGLVFYRKL